MKDTAFKNLNHRSSGYEIERISFPHYKPDVVLSKGNEYIILESERNSNRKTYIGGLVKACRFMDGDKSGILVFVMREYENTKATSIQAQLRMYFQWLQSLGQINLTQVFVITHEQYCPGTEPIELLSDDFNTEALEA